MARATRAPRSKPPKTIRHHPNAPEPAQAAQIAVLTMKAVGVKRWEELLARPLEEVRSKVVLDQEQQSLLEKYARVLGFLKTSPPTTLAACTGCGRYGLAGSGTVGSRCGFTRGCDGKVVKAALTAYSEKRNAPKRSPESGQMPGAPAADLQLDDGGPPDGPPAT